MNMKRVIAVLAVILFLVGMAGKPPSAAAGYEELFKAVKATAWAIYLRSQGGLNAICSAIAYKTDRDSTLLLTAGHCFMGSDAKTDFLVTQDHLRFVSATLVKTGLKLNSNATPSSLLLADYTGEDWAIVRAKVGDRSVFSIGKSSQLVLGEDLIAVGVPLGVDFLAVQGIVGSTDLSLSQTPWNHYFGANMYIASGNSGSGVVSTKQKAVVGILVAGPGSQSSMAVFAPIDLVEFP